MKRIITVILLSFLFSNIITAQENFDGLWKKVQRLEMDNLPKSALKIVDEIHEKAVKENNSPQLIKALFYKSKFALTLEENAQLNIINSFKQQISNSNFPVKNVLENILANLYWQYFNQNRWRFYNRTQTAQKVDENDFRTWDLNTLFAEINHYYSASLSDKLFLQKINIDAFSVILQKAKNSEEFRPTLFDFLAHNALTFYKTSENSITKPTYQFKIDDPAFLSDASTFSRLHITTKDTLSLELKALKIYQDLIGFHLVNNNFKALTKVDLERLGFVYQHATFNNKQDLFLKTLETSAKQYSKNEVSGLYKYEIAQIYNQQANKNSIFRFKKTDALAICKTVIKQFPDSESAKKCAYLKSQIEEKTIQIIAENFVPINTNSRLLINYKNINKVHFTAFRANRNFFNKLQTTHNESEKIKLINSLKKAYSWEASLRNEYDYLQHTTEVITPKMTQGDYLIVATEKNALQTGNLYGISHLKITNIALVELNENGVYTYQVVNRNNGAPIPNATVTLKNYNTDKYNKPIDKNFITNKNGFFSYKSNTSHNQIVITVNFKGDTTYFDNYYINKYYKPKERLPKVNVKTFLFTDRSIYRPGQTVYFKGISIETFKNKSTLKVGETVSINIKDVNNQLIKSKSLTTNEFGSFSGEFVLPTTGLTGQFNIEAQIDGIKNYHTISVEEYKRPKFETEFNPITNTYKLNDTITVTGFAKAFSGSTITNAKVVYRVHRKVKFPNWWYWKRPYFIANEQEITHGKSTTDDQGNFTFSFKALPDESLKKESLPVFNYQVTVDVTDINGETHSATSTIKIGYHTLLATVQIPEKIYTSDNKTNIEITSKNLNGTFVSAKGNIKIYKLQAPQNPVRKRPWGTPDYQDISETEFRKLFPHDAYTKEEENASAWKQEKLVFEQAFNTKKAKKITLTNYKKWAIGKYIIVLSSKDKFGQKVTDKAIFSVVNTREKIIPDNQLFVYTTDKKMYKIGDHIHLQIGSASKDVTVMLQIEKKQKIVKTIFTHLNNNLKTITIPVTKEDLGGFAIKYYFVNYNSFVSGSIPILVPNTQETISIETNTFRDKLQPGTNETWSFTIKNDKKNKVTAEILASMYDASLDQFKPNNWQFNPITITSYNSYQNHASANHSFGIKAFRLYNNRNTYTGFAQQQYDQLNWFGFEFARNRPIFLSESVKYKRSPAIEANNEVYGTAIPATESDKGELDNVAITTLDQKKIADEKASLKNIQIRKNLQETAFFYPHLITDKKGNVTFSFTTPESLTKWKLQLLAHTKTLQSTIKTLTAVTQKELMVTPNAPRFLREGDTITLSAKIANISNKNLSGTAQLLLTDAITGKNINLLEGAVKNQSFQVNANGNSEVSWNLSIPNTYQAIQYKVVAKAGDFSDGEQNILPVLSNRMLVTETLPMWVRSNQTKTFVLNKLKNNTSTTLNHHKLTLEITSNPAWYAVQALPYLMEYPYECSEQTFARYYANTLASFIANSNPRIQEVFNAWKSSGALLSNLEKNQELKSLIIQETPWLREAQSETEQKKRIALLFDLNKMKNEEQNAINKLAKMQFNNGGFPWFKGGRYPNIYITNHIATGFGHLKKLGVTNFNQNTTAIIKKAVHFLDQEIEKNYQKLIEKATLIKADKGVKAYTDYLEKNHINYFIIQYLYMRSFYKQINIDDKVKTAIAYYKNQTATYWSHFNLYAKGQIALLQHRSNNNTIAAKILKSLKENSITSEELGMYWKENQPSWYWYQAPIETQALLIEAFSEIENDTQIVDNLKIWLLKNKQTTQWKTTKATTEAVYALLLQGSDWVSVTDNLTVKIGGQPIKPSKLENTKIEAGTGYFKTSWNSTEITPKMSTISISKKGKGTAWGSLYWQYFENIDKITPAKTPLQLTKHLFKKVNSDTGKKLIQITNTTPLKVGDLITVRIELRSDREMDFIHMKDTRASGVEPINVLSQYKWQDGLGYYENTTDTATNFFFGRLPKGIYVFEYDVRVNNVGNFSNGITTIQSMYAPEFSSHSKGQRLSIQ
ncbi:alpha-2-macroglobulin [Tenacibaculum sp. UWU-22]|uniref:alpha-2-macroglobulin family protein n=1 Tax=Tenacibaculum sp. UWU-22 TaxID=3234187 RepID=UPI0034DB675F